MKRLALCLGVAVAACSEPEPIPPFNDVPEQTEYEGEGSSGIPGFLPGVIDGGENQLEDAGVIVVDPCCTIPFRIGAGIEPPEAEARAVGEAGPLRDGVALQRVDGGWEASACYPLNTSGYYWYEFRWPTDPDGGAIPLEDGGALALEVRHSDWERHYDTVDGTRNYVPSSATCAELDAGR